MYMEIEKIQKKILYYVFLLGVSVIMIKSTCFRVIVKVEFFLKYCFR